MLVAPPNFFISGMGWGATGTGRFRGEHFGNMSGFDAGYATEHTIKQTDSCHRLFLLWSQAYEDVWIFRALTEEKRRKSTMCDERRTRTEKHHKAITSVL